jgi:hypothetical protein
MNQIKISYCTEINFASNYIINFVYEKTYMSIPYWVVPSDCYEQ